MMLNDGATWRKFLAHAPEEWVRRALGGTTVEEHAPGAHDQKSHGRRGGGSDPLVDMLPKAADGGPQWPNMRDGNDAVAVEWSRKVAEEGRFPQALLDDASEGVNVALEGGEVTERHIRALTAVSVVADAVEADRSFGGKPWRVRKGLDEGGYDRGQTIGAALEAKGYGAKPKVTDSLEYGFDPATGVSDKQVFRGVPDHRFHKQLVEGPLYTGNGVLGAGIYTAPKSSANKWAREHGEDKAEWMGTTPGYIEMKIPAKARIVTDTELVQASERLTSAYDQVYSRERRDKARAPLENAGYLAAMGDYDAVRGERYDEYIVLNRGVVETTGRVGSSYSDGEVGDWIP